MQQFGIRGCFEIQNDGFFALVDPDKVRAIPKRCLIVTPSKVSRGAFNLDHACASFHEASSAKGRSDGLFDRNDQ
jgi:hypothetical protein